MKVILTSTFEGLVWFSLNHFALLFSWSKSVTRSPSVHRRCADSSPHLGPFHLDKFQYESVSKNVIC